ncbi:hypothetical protein ACTVKR_24420 [Serratia bockelmannii]|uniref:hypothetical protein n=1 Tax=Serratia bockelmannii TaxID=2703793 RepID=UPI003FA6A5AC
MDANTIVNLVIGGVIGWLSGYLPFVKKLDADNITRTIANIIFGVIGGGAGAAAVDGIFENAGTLSLVNLPSLIGAVVGSGLLSTISSIIVSKIKG